MVEERVIILSLFFNRVSNVCVLCRDEFREKLKQVKLNQAELDRAMERWQSQVVSYQEEANLRAREKAAQELQQRRLRAMHERISKQEEHKRNMQK